MWGLSTLLIWVPHGLDLWCTDRVSHTMLEEFWVHHRQGLGFPLCFGGEGLGAVLYLRSPHPQAYLELIGFGTLERFTWTKKGKGGVLRLWEGLRERPEEHERGFMQDGQGNRNSGECTADAMERLGASVGE